MSKKVLIVGGVAGGATTAARLRRMDEDAEIIMFERGEYISFANCGLPYYIGGSIKERDALLLQTPEAMKKRFNIDVRVFNEVISIDKEAKNILIKDLKNNTEYEESYDVLVLSTGSTPIKPPIKGIDSDNVFSLWNIPDTDKIKNYIDNNKIKSATVIGGGFIGIEMAENLHDLGFKVSLAEMAPQIMTPVDYDMAQVLHAHLASKGVDLFLNNGVKEFNNKGKVTDVVLQDGTVIESDIVIFSIGIRPNSELAKGADLELNQRGGVVVNDHMKTSDENIYALGDMIEVKDFVNGNKSMVPLAGPANKQGRIVANNICGVDEAYKGTQGTSVAKVFDLTVASTGNNEKLLQSMGKEYGKDYLVALAFPKSHAGYYPGAQQLTVKLIFDMDGIVLGAQVIGVDGADKRVDVIATAIRFGATVYDLKELELAYAPPFSSAKDPVNMVAFVAENILKEKMVPMLPHEVEDIDYNNTILLDVRTQPERDAGYIENSITIPVDDLRANLDKLDKDKEIAIYCAVGLRGYIASNILMANGFKTKNLLGGYGFYKNYVRDNQEISEVFSNKHGNVDCEGRTEEEIKKKDYTKLDARGLQCPGPIMQLAKKIHEVELGKVLEVAATDPGFVVDAVAWCKKTGNTYLHNEQRDGAYYIYIRRGTDVISNHVSATKDSSTMVVFSGDLDKALASFIIANGAAAMGKEVTMFFTFWGLNILRKPEKIEVEKGTMEKMFSMMMPRGEENLTLSKMNFGGVGSAMMKKIMKDKNVNPLDELMQSAKESGVKLIACTMSMDIMGIKKEELIDGVDFGGVGAYLGAADESNHNLFI